MRNPVRIETYILAILVSLSSCYLRTCGNLLKLELQNDGRDYQTHVING